jgi:hypothetical protein
LFLLREIDYKYLESFEIWCWRTTEKINWTDRGRNEEVIHRFKDGRDVLYTIKRRKDKWIGDIFRRNCLLNTFLKERYKEKEKWGKEEEEDLSSYRMTLTKRKDTGN